MKFSKEDFDYFLIRFMFFILVTLLYVGIGFLSGNFSGFLFLGFLGYCYGYVVRVFWFNPEDKKEDKTINDKKDIK